MSFPAFLSFAAIEELKQREPERAKSQEHLARTPEQIQAIYSNGTNILVSASAGSGKTFVMVERIIDMLKRGVAINRLFISTFTVKAAGELKDRLEKRLEEEIAASQDLELKQHLSSQMADLATADIGTMDAFSQKLVNTYGYSLGISPNFRIMQDESEQASLKKEVYDDLFAAYMTGPDGRIFRKLVRNFIGNSKDSRSFRSLVDSIYQFSQSTANPKQWLQEVLLRPYQEDVKSQAQNFLSTYLKSHRLAETLDQTEKFFKDHLEVARGEFQKKGKYQENVENLLEVLARVDLHGDLGQLYQDLQAIQTISSGRNLTMLAGRTADEDLKAFVKDYNEERKQILEPFLKLEQVLKPLELLTDFQPDLLDLLELLRDFLADYSQQYLEKKKGEAAFEFSDIAHLAIEILEANPEIRQLYQAKYQEVMVDEYQDNNHMQERLLDLLSNGHNRFMVGDVKQSIYRFRQADPKIFQAKFQTYDQPESFQVGKSQGLLILLKENFRSHLEVLQTSNAVFSRLMDQDIGELVYDQSHWLQAGNAQKAEAIPANRTQVFIYDDSQDQKENQGQDLLEAGDIRLVAQEIIRLHKEEGVAFDQIALLVSSRNRNDEILSTLKNYGLPVVSEDTGGHYLQALEVMVMLETLRTINNPLQDQSLVALLKSPMFNFGEDLLTRISLQAKSGNFYDKLLLALSETGDNPQLITAQLHGKIQAFNQVLTAWRNFAKTNSLHDLIWKIYEDKFYYDYVGALSNGQQRQANLYALTVRANQFEKSGFKGLPRFINMIDRVLNNEKDLADVEVALSKDAIQLMTIHQSKGLEFPYVFILNLHKSFNKEDEKNRAVLSRDHGLGVRYVVNVADRFPQEKLTQLRLSFDTFPFLSNKQALHRADLSEQMRKLYVAMTRAETRLYLVGRGSQAKLQGKYENYRDQEHLALAGREKWISFQDWFLALKQNFPEADLAFDLNFVSQEDLDQLTPLQPSLPLDVDDQSQNRQSDDIKQALDALEAVEELNHRYQAAINLPTVRTPSQIKKFYQPVMEDQGLDIMEKRILEPKFDLPSFGKESRVTGAAIGSATHELMQRLPIKPNLSLADLQATLKEVQAEPAVKQRINLTNLLEFFRHHSLGQEIMSQGDRLVREAPFAMLYEDWESHEKMVIRGIVDGYIRYEDHIVLFDYKTDHYQSTSELVQRYQDQMKLYAQALGKSFDQTRIEKYLILLGGKEVVVEKLD